MKFLIFIIIFQVCTLMLYVFGPVSYPDIYNRSTVVSYVLFYLACILIGGYSSRNLILEPKYKKSNPNKFVKFSAIATIIFTVVSIALGVTVAGYDFGDSYAVNSELSLSYEAKIINYLRMLFSIFLVGFLPAFFLLRDKLSLNVKIIGYLAVIFYVLGTVLSGVNRYIYDVVIVLISSVFVLGHNFFEIVSNNKKKIIALLPIAFLASYLFTQSQLLRYGSGAIYGLNPRTGAMFKYNSSDSLFGVFYSSIASYLGQGYRAFELALDTEFSWTYGVGNSTFLSRQIENIFGVDIQNGTYPAKVELYGWDRFNYWSTAYLWFASDLSFLGVGLLMFAYGFIYVLADNTFKKTKSTLIAVLLGMLWIFGFYLSANNQLFQSGERFIAFFATFFLILIGFTLKIKNRAVVRSEFVK